MKENRTYNDGVLARRPDQKIADFIHNRLRKEDYESVAFSVQHMDMVQACSLLRMSSETDVPLIFRLFPKGLAAEVFEHMGAPFQAQLLEAFTNSSEALRLIRKLEADDQLRLFDELPSNITTQLLDMLPKTNQEDVRRLMSYPDDTVGRIMSPAYYSFKQTAPLSEVLHIVRAGDAGRDAVHVYVCNEDGGVCGSVPLTAVLAEKDETRLIGDMVTAEPVVIRVQDDQEKAARLIQRLAVFELPVCDDDGYLVGTLRAYDALDVISEEVTDDMYDKVGLLDLNSRESDRSYGLIHKGFGHVFAVRVPFLIITLIGGMLAGGVIEVFEDILDAVAATALFIPVIMDMGGNVGTQSSTIFTRAMVLGQINMERFIKHWIRETLHGVGLGAILGVLGGGIAIVWQGSPELGLAVGLSLWATITIATSLGFLVPFLLIKMGFDQAAGSDPIITTVKDMTGLAIYFGMVSLLLPGLVS
ncbi:magnesium transporter [Chitinivibrio alkaliphilus]|uniref:Magnesium transporter MgtE n=1 Tax=Chitinivibrio alkaliphilus ACht1 TaxID=1313304 RepID=U7D9Q4_9BACT|nr:magnesium transporter [Chitinivibrio alkaliphilus]ERP31817.1 magnesium transporter, MgtE [Chitinivibrio alkaliphilus ACht1]